MEFNVNPFKSFVFFTLEVNSKITYDKEKKYKFWLHSHYYKSGEEISFIFVTQDNWKLWKKI